VKPLYFGDQIEWRVRTETGDVWLPGEVSYIGSLVDREGPGRLIERADDAYAFAIVGSYDVATWTWTDVGVTTVRGKLSDLPALEGVKWRRREVPT
jgi:hypothetical protein